MKNRIKLTVFLIMTLFIITQNAKAQSDTLWTTTKIKALNDIKFTLDGTKLIIETGNFTLMSSDSANILISYPKYLLAGDMILSPDSSCFISKVTGAIYITQIQTSSIQTLDSFYVNDFDFLNMGSIRSYAISKDSKYIYATVEPSQPKNQNSVYLYKVNINTKQVIQKKVFKYVTILINIVDNKIIIATEDSLTQHFAFQNLDTSNLNVINSYPQNNTRLLLSNLDCSRSGRYLAVMDQDSNINVWDTQLNSMVNSLKLTYSIYPDVFTFTSNDSLIAINRCNDTNCHIEIWNVISGQLIHVYPVLNYLGGAGYVDCIDISPDGSKIVAGLNGLGIIMLQTNLKPMTKRDTPDPSALFSVKPNPTGQNVLIELQLIEPSTTSISLYDESGNLIKEISNQFFDTGLNQINYNTSGLSNGVYFIRALNDKFNKTEKIIIMK